MAYSESDTRSKLIDPSIKESAWLESNIEIKTRGERVFAVEHSEFILARYEKDGVKKFIPSYKTKGNL